MMRQYTKEEIELHNKLKRNDLSESERKGIENRLKEIYMEQTKNSPFAH